MAGSVAGFVAGVGPRHHDLRCGSTGLRHVAIGRDGRRRPLGRCHGRWEAQKAEALKRLAAGPTRARVAAAVLRGDLDMAAQLASASDDALAYRVALQACRNRRQLCEQVARRMSAWVTSTSDAAALHGMEKGLGLPHSPQALSPDESRRLAQQAMAEFVQRANDFSCAGFSSNVRELKAMAAQGDLAYQRARAASGASR